MLYRVLSYIKFFVNATNEHGVHSPFIYNFVTKCLYAKTKIAKNRTENIVLKSISYFSYHKVKRDQEVNYSKLSALNKLNANLQPPYDIIHITAANNPNITIAKTNYHNNTMLVVEGIYHNIENTRAWERLKQQDYVKVTVDVYYCGIVFFRAEQAKEHFKIRL